jgi:hypothetical protein
MNWIRKKWDWNKEIRLCWNVLTEWIPWLNTVRYIYIYIYICVCPSYMRLLAIGCFGMKNIMLFSKYRYLGGYFILLSSCKSNVNHLAMISSLIEKINTICTKPVISQIKISWPFWWYGNPCIDNVGVTTVAVELSLKTQTKKYACIYNCLLLHLLC